MKNTISGTADYSAKAAHGSRFVVRRSCFKAYAGIIGAFCFLLSPTITLAQDSGVDDGSVELPPITVTGSSGCAGSQPTHGFTAGCSGGAFGGSGPNHGGSSGGQGPVGGVGGSLPPIPGQPPDCDTGDPEIDNTADLREYLMGESLEDDDLRLEFGGLFWPNGSGGYDLLEYGVDVPGGGPGTCQIAPPPISSFPEADEWPDGVIFFHTHPFTHGDYIPACGGPYRAGVSDGDRDHLAWLQANFSDSVEGMVMDEISIYRFGETASEDKPTTRRCK